MSPTVAKSSVTASIAIQRRDQQPRAHREHRHARRDLARILLREGLGLLAGVFQVVARGVEILLDVDVLHLRAEIIDHLVADAELAEELLEAAVAAEGLAALRTDPSARRALRRRLARGHPGRSCSAQWCIHAFPPYQRLRRVRCSPGS